MLPPKISGKKSESAEAELLSQLEKSRVEYDNIKQEKERMERSKQV